MIFALILLSLGFLGGGVAAFLIVRAGGGTAHRKWLFVSVLGAVLLSGGVYAVIGRPGLPDEPFAPRIAKIEQGDIANLSKATISVLLQDAARKNPNDPQPHAYYGRILMSEGRYEEALRAFMAALRRDPKFADALAGVGQSLLAINGAPTPAAISALEQAVAAMPESEPRRARILLMLSALKSMQGPPAAESGAKPKL